MQCEIDLTIYRTTSIGTASEGSNQVHCPPCLPLHVSHLDVMGDAALRLV